MTEAANRLPLPAHPWSYFRCVIVGQDPSLVISCGECLLQKGHHICAVVSEEMAIQEWARENGVYLIQSKKNIEEQLKREELDYLFSVSNPWILSQKVLTLPRMLAINFHNAPLPKYAGINATHWALMNGETEHGVTWHVMTEELDAGDILKQRRFLIREGETVSTLNTRCFDECIQCFSDLIDELAEDQTKPVKQETSNRTYFGRWERPPAACTINWTQSAEKMDALIRSLDYGRNLNPLGLPKINLGNEAVVVKRVKVQKLKSTLPPGTIVSITEGTMEVATKTHQVSLSEFLSFTGESISPQEILQYSSLRVGDRLPLLEKHQAKILSQVDSTFCRHEQYWAGRLESLVPVELPYAKPVTFREYKRKVQEVVFKTPGETLVHWKNKGNLGDRVVAALGVYFSRIGRRSEFDVAFRNQELEAKLAGTEAFFASHVPLHFDVDPKKKFEEFFAVHQVKQKSISRRGSFARDLTLRHPDLDRVEIRQQIHRLPVAISRITDLSGCYPEAASPLHVIIPDNGELCVWVFDSNIFDKAAIEQMQHQLTLLLEDIARPNSQPISRLPLLSEQEKRKVLVEWNDTKKDYPNACIHELFEEQVERTPNTVAVEFEEEQLTYRELNERANQLAHYLQKFGVGPEVLVGILAERSLEMVVILLGILKAGGAYVPVDPAFPKERIEFMLEDAQVHVLLTQKQLLEILPVNFDETTLNQSRKIICIDSDWNVIAQESTENLGYKMTPESLAFVIYTSGSTGKPKGAMNTHRGICNRLHWMQSALLHLTTEDRVLQKATFSFDTSVWEFFLPLLNGVCVIMARPGGQLDNGYLVKIIAEKKITLLSFVPSMLQVFLEEQSLNNLYHLRNVICGGEVLPANLHDRFFSRLGAKLHNSYGPTETSIAVTCWTCQPDMKRSVIPIGRPISNVQNYILDKHLQPVPIGASGELHIGGACVGRGYLNQPDLTSERFITDPFSSEPGARLYKTGDLARYLRDGNIEFLGRIDDQVKIRGIRIELGEIETLLSNHPGIDQCVILAREDTPGDNRLVAYLVGSQEEAPSTSDLRAFLKEKLPDYMIPAAFVMLDILPRTANGKVNRKALPAPEMSRPDLKNRFVAPRTPAEKTLAEIWIALLKVERIGIHDNFFELGGHSLLATRVIARSRSEINVEIPLATFFESPTVGMLAQKIGQGEIEGADHDEIKHSARKHFILRRKEDVPCALSFAQERLWFLDQFEPNTSLYHISHAFRLTGPLDRNALEKALQALVSRHETLRTTFCLQDEVPVQIIQPDRSIELEEIDLRGRREEEAQRLISEEADRPFDLTRDLMLRAKLYRLSNGEHILLLVIHHIASDGWSMGVLYRELSELYMAYAAGRSPSLPELPIQYADYAEWQREWLDEKKAEEQLAYWKEHLAGIPPLLELPTDRPRPECRTYRGSHEKFVIPLALSGALKDFSRKEKTTLFMTLFAGFQALLYRYTGSEDIAVGTPIAGRTRVDTERLIGFFVNTLVLRTDLSGNPTFRELLGRVREIALGAYGHQDLPFEKLVAELQPERSLSHSPMFQVLFVLQNVHSETLTLTGLKSEMLPLDTATSKFDLTLYLQERDDVLEGHLEYNTDLFDRETTIRIQGHYQTLLEKVVKDPSQPISTVPILSGNERHQQLSEWNDTQTAYPTGVCIHDLFEAQAARTPDATAVVFEDEQLTFEDLNKRANQLAHYLRRRGVGPEVMVGLLVGSSLEMVVGLLGILKAGGAYVPLDPEYPPERMAFMLEDTRAPVLVTQERFLETLPAHGAHVVCLDVDWPVLDQEPRENPVSGVRGENLFYVIYTSGSTGNPKGVAVEHRQLSHYVNAVVDRMALPDDTSYAMVSSIAADAGITMIFPPLCNGGCLHVLSQEHVSDPEAMADYFESHPVDCLKMVPSLLEMLLTAKNPERGLPRKLLMVGGESTRLDLVERFQALNPGCRLINHYGPTEATVGVTTYWVEEPLPAGAATLPIGRPLANSQIYLLDAHLEPVPMGVSGELHIGGANLAREYLNLPKLTAEKFIPDPFSDVPGARLYKTGDQARYLPDGSIEFLGRIDDQVKIRGFRIELGEIEAVLSDHSAVDQCVVLAREDVPGDKRLVAYLVGTREETPAAPELRSFLKERLPDYMVPTAFVMLDALPRTPNGKVNRKALPGPDTTRPELEKAYVAPRTEMEKTLAKIWIDVLKVDKVGIQDNFFELGGHSLLATVFISRARKTLNIDLPIRSVFENPTVAELAQKIGKNKIERSGHVEMKPSPRKHFIPRKKTKGPYALSFSQERLWFLEQLEECGSAYNIFRAFRLKGELDKEALRKALQAIVDRHDSLRTTFHLQGDVPVQVVDSDRTIDLEEFDLRGKPEEDAWHLIDRDAEIPFDLTQDLMLRASLYQLSEGVHVLLLVMHHIASDGWSMGIFYRELSEIYADYAAGRTPTLPALPMHYADFAVWQREWLTGERMEEELSFWKECMAGSPALLELPTDRPRPVRQTYRGAREKFALPEELFRAVQKFSQKEHATLFITLLSVFQTLLYRYVGSEDIVVGSPIAGRTNTQIEGIIGFFVNTLLFRADLSGNPTFRQLVKRIRDMALNAYDHQVLPFEKLVAELQPERNLSYSPLFQIMFILHNAHSETLNLPGLKSEQQHLETSTSKFDLTLSLRKAGETLEGILEYNTNLFDRSTIRRMVGQFQTLLQSAVIDPECSISNLPILSDNERRQLLVEWNCTQKDHPNFCIHELFEKQVEKTPGATAVVFEEAHLTYTELNQRANQVAHHLQKRRVGPETLVGICLERSFEMVVGLLGILKAGGAYVPLDPSYPKQRLAFMLEDSGASVLVTQGRLLSELPSYECEVVCLDTDQESIAQERKENPTSDVTAEALAYVLYTSGSTGKPKGVAMPHGPLVNLLAWQCGHSACGEAVRTLQYAPFGFDVSFQEIFSTWCSGGTLVLINDDQRRDPVKMLHLIDQKKIKRLFLPFVALEQLAEAACRMGLLPASLREVITAGEQLRVTPEILHLFEQLPGCQLVNQYGPTEAHVVSACELSGAPDNWSRLPPIGRPISNATLYVLDQNLEPAPIGVPGELHIGGTSLARGYLNRPELTAEKFISDPFSKAPGERLYKTGDLCRYLQDGNIEFLGRIDDQVKVRGFRIELGEIEVVLQKHPGVGACAVIDREDVSGNKRLVAYVVASGQQAPSVEGLRDFLQNELPEYMVPTTFVMLDSLPLTPSGKVDHRALPAPDHRRPELEKAYVAPRTETEEALADIWAKILQVEQVGINDNFFELGGHSLMATRVIARVHSQMGEKIPLVTLFELPTVGQLARKLAQQSPKESCPDGTTNERQTEEIPRRRSKGPCALSFAQERLWFLDQLEPNTSLFHISNAYRLEGALDRIALEKALRTIVARHETIRTTYRMEDERPVQVINPNQTIELEESDLRGMGYKEAQLLVQEEARRPFDLSRDLMLRATLYRLDGDAHVLLLVMHHIASDGWSMGILYRELSELYMAYTVGRPPDLQELSIQYADYAELQREWLKGEKPKAQLSYWKEQLAGSSALLNLPTDRPRPPRQTFQGALETEFLPEELTAAIKSLSQREGCTLFMALLAGFQTLLHRCTGQDEIVVGAPIAGRTQSELEKLIGVFLNTLALRGNLSGNPTFCELLGRVREVTLSAYANQEVPFEKLLEELKPERDLSRTPLFQVFFNMMNYSNPGIEMHGLKVDAYALPDRLSKFDLTLYVKEQDREIRLDWVYNIDLFDQLTISTMAKHFRTLLKSIVADPAQRLSNLQLLTESEQNLRSVRANGHFSKKPFVEFTKEAISQSIPDRFREQVRKYPHNIAVKTKNHEWTYEQLNRESNRVSQAIFDLSGHGEERIAVLFDHDAPMIAAIFGALKAGKTYVPLDPEYPVERLAYVLANSGANLLLADDLNHSLAKELIDGKGIQLVNTNQLETIEADQMGCAAVSPEDLAYILYTSGSTGHPKGVVQNHQNVLHHIKNYTNALHIGADDKLTLLSSYGFDAAIMDIFGALLNGATLYPMNIKEERVGNLRKLLMKEEITIYHSTPTAFRYLFSGLAEGETFPQIRSVVLGGEEVDLRDVNLYKRHFSSKSTLINCFGASESSLTSLYPVHHETPLTRNSVPIGHPVENLKITLVDERGHDTEVFGEIAIKGPQVALGYWQNSEMTQAVFLPDPTDKKSRIYRTGDMGRLLPDGAVEFLGRKDRQIKIRGFRIEPGEVEARLLDHPAVSECVVISHGAQDNETLLAYVTTGDPAPPSVQDLRDHLAKSLPQYMIPSHFLFLDTLPRTPNGKIDQRALPEPESTRPELEKTFVAPRTEVEKDLAEIWIGVLKVDRVGIYDNFFELGGHSLLATQIVSRIRAQMNVDLPLITLFESPTIKELAEAIFSNSSYKLEHDELSRLLDEIEEDSGQ